MARISKNDIAKIAKVLGARKVTQDKESYRMRITGEDEVALTLMVYPRALLGKSRGTLITVYTHGAHLQLHNCSGYVISEELGEVTFVSESEDRLSGLVIGRDAFASEYSAVSRDLISSDFTQLGVEVMLSGVAMSLAEDIVSTDEDEEA